MVAQAGPAEVLLLFAGDSLAVQAAAWVRGHPRIGLRLLFPSSVSVVDSAVRGAALALIDATEDKDRAIALLDQAIARIGPRRVAIYTERMHRGLEPRVRSRGSLVMLGPLSQAEWSALLAHATLPA